MAPEDPNEKKLPRFGGNERFVVDAETFRVHNLPDGERGGEGEAKLSRSGNERFVGDGSGLEVTKSPPGSPADIESYEPSAQTTPVLLADWAAIMRELRVRDVIRTNNNPVGDIAEAIVHAHYGGERGSFSQAGWDVKTPEGERIQVKALRQTATGKRRNLSPIRDTDYDSVVIVLLDEDFRVTEGLKLTREVVEDLFEHRPYVNGRVITVTAALRADKRVEKVGLAVAAKGLTA
jgi:hypothetical protein